MLLHWLPGSFVLVSSISMLEVTAQPALLRFFSASLCSRGAGLHGQADCKYAPMRQLVTPRHNCELSIGSSGFRLSSLEMPNHKYVVSAAQLNPNQRLEFSLRKGKQPLKKGSSLAGIAKIDRTHSLKINRQVVGRLCS